MKWFVSLILLATFSSAHAQAWKTLPKGVRILGYRNVTTSKISSNFNRTGGESSLGTEVKLDGKTIDAISGYMLSQGGMSQAGIDALQAGTYKVDAQAQFNVQGMGFGWGLTDKLMIYGEVAYYTAQIQARLKRTAGNTYNETAKIEEGTGSASSGAVAPNLRSLPDINVNTIQSYITNGNGYKPLGDWYGTGYGDMETGLMYKAIDKGTTGLLLYPGVILPTGRQDDPDILQDVGFGDGQYDFFGEMASGYMVNDALSFGTTFRYTYQAPTTKKLRVPTSIDNSISNTKGNFTVKYGDKLNYMVNGTYKFNDWIAITPVYRFMYTSKSKYGSDFTAANQILAYNTDRMEHQAQMTATFSSITPFLKKQFLLPAQVNINAVQTIAGRNVPKATRFEVEFRMLF